MLTTVCVAPGGICEGRKHTHTHAGATFYSIRFIFTRVGAGDQGVFEFRVGEEMHSAYRGGAVNSS